jgi:hypothetical protein
MVVLEFTKEDGSWITDVEITDDQYENLKKLAKKEKLPFEDYVVKIIKESVESEPKSKKS